MRDFDTIFQSRERILKDYEISDSDDDEDEFDDEEGE